MKAKFFVIVVSYRGNQVLTKTLDSFTKVLKAFRKLETINFDAAGTCTVEICFKYSCMDELHVLHSIKCDNQYSVKTTLLSID